MSADKAVQITSGNKTCPQPGLLTCPHGSEALPLSSHTTHHAKTAPKVAQSSAHKEEDLTGSQTPLLATTNTSMECIVQSNPLPNPCSQKLVEDETKGALPPERHRMEHREKAAGKCLIPAPAAHFRKNKRSEEQRKGSMKDTKQHIEASRQDRTTATRTRCRRPIGPGLQQNNAGKCPALYQLSLSYTSLNSL